LRALVTAYQQAEVVFDSAVEKLVRDILPRCEDIERISDQKLDQLYSLREIYNAFAPLETEAALICQPVKAICKAKEKDRLICEQDLDTLKKVFVQIKENEQIRRGELEKQVKAAQTQTSQLAAEQTAIQALIANLTQRYQTNEQQMKLLALQESNAIKEMEGRGGVRISFLNKAILWREKKFQAQVSTLWLCLGNSKFPLFFFDTFLHCIQLGLIHHLFFFGFFFFVV